MHIHACVSCVRARICQCVYVCDCSCCVGLAVHVQQRNTDRFTKAVYDRPKGTPLITVSNHLSCIDDPIIWGKLSL